MRRIDRQRRGVSLFELLVVVTLIGIFSAVVAMRYGRTLFAEFGAQGTARELSLALLGCQRASIHSGDDHFVEFLSSGGRISSYRIMRTTSGAPALVDGPKSLSADVTVTVSSSTMQFNFEGGALANYWIDIVGQSQTWRVEVVPISGAVRVTQTG
jgi:prepilin-type N-terminal cleavage/methylation domain-containing protein